jgi:hypothetical protein
MLYTLLTKPTLVAQRTKLYESPISSPSLLQNALQKSLLGALNHH